MCTELVPDVSCLWGDKFKPELSVIFCEVQPVYRFIVSCDCCFEVPIEQLALGCSWESGKGVVNEIFWLCLASDLELQELVEVPDKDGVISPNFKP